MQVITLVNEKPKSCEGCMFESEYLMETDEYDTAEITESGIAFKVTTECFLTHIRENSYDSCPLIEISRCVSNEGEAKKETSNSG